MIKEIFKRSVAIGLLVIISLGFTYKTNLRNPSIKKAKEVMLPAYVPTEAESKFADNYSFPFLGKTYIGFKEALAFKESTGDYKVINPYGYLGKYQFSANTLKLVGVYSPYQFIKNPELQEKAFTAYTSRNKWVLRKDIERFVGLKLRGVQITESGILAAAHLAGPGNVKRYLRSYGKTGYEDGNGTSIRHYMKHFSGYDTSIIIANRNAGV
jgi:hypothetical protein